MSGPVCSECGFHADTVMPLDLSRAVRSFPRRYRALLTGFDHDEDADALVRRRPDPSTPSALELAGEVADRLDSVAPVIRRMDVEDQPTIAIPARQRKDVEEPDNEKPVRQVVSELENASADLAMTLETVDDEDWTRIAHFPDGEHDIIGVARDAVHLGSHNLRRTEAVLQQVRGRPLSDG